MLPGFFVFQTVVTIGSYLLAFFMCSAEAVATSTNPFSFVKDLIFFQLCDGLPTWFGLLAFTLITLPWLFMLCVFLFSMFGSEIGAAAAVIIGAVVLITAFFV